MLRARHVFWSVRITRRLGGELLALASGLLRARHVFGLLRARAAYILYINRFNIAVTR